MNNENEILIDNMKNETMNIENTEINESLYNTFKTQRIKRKYYSNDIDFYLYSQIYLELKKNQINLPFYDKHKINYSLIFTILMNDLFGNYDFYNSFIMQFMDPENTYYNKINNIYNDSNLKVKKFNLIFKQSLLQYKYCKELFNIKSEFFNLDFNKKYNVIMFHKSKIKTIFFISSFLEKINLDNNYFLYNKKNINVMDNDKYDKFFLNNYYFKNFINVHNINELYTSFLNFDNSDHLKNSIKMKREKDFLFFEDLNNKIIVSKHADGYGIFSKKFNVSFEKTGNLMITFFKKINDSDIELHNVIKYIPYVNDKMKIENMKVPKKSLGDTILLKYNVKNKTYNFYEFTLKENTFSNESIKINLSYVPSSKMVIIIINDERVENLYYLLKKHHILRFVKNKKKFVSIAQLRKNGNDIICNILQIILPFEYIIIQVILYFESITQKGGLYNPFKSKERQYQDNSSLESKLLKELGKSPSKSSSDYRIFSLFDNNKIKDNIKSTQKLIKANDISNLITDISNESFKIEDQVYDQKELLSKDLEEYSKEDKNKCLQYVIRDTDSWLFQYYFYKAKCKECNYYYKGFEEYFTEKQEEITRNNNKKQSIINKLENDIKEKSDKTNTNTSEKILNERKTGYILGLREILCDDNNYFNELLMMFQFNKNWIDNYYNSK